jgi:hypothetical protein
VSVRPLLCAALLAAQPALAAGELRHELRISLDPAAHRLAVEDRITLPAGQPAEFVLNARLTLTRAEPPVSELPEGDVPAFLGVDSKGAPLKRYRARTLPADGKLTVAYSGPFDFSLSPEREEYTRGFRETAGIVGEQGLYLSGDGVWYPRFGPGLVEFSLEAEAPPGWQLISEGRGSSRDASGVARWDSQGPSDEIHLVGGPLRRYRDQAGAVETLVYLHEKDEALAGKYLAATARYLEMYRGLIGPYPYAKFALVENFWETGYGMPSFTLLGPQVIRFPFILTSSYPHEILHNWWGNSVFVDPASGSWCEGLTRTWPITCCRSSAGRAPSTGARRSRDTATT